MTGIIRPFKFLIDLIRIITLFLYENSDIDFYLGRKLLELANTDAAVILNEGNLGIRKLTKCGILSHNWTNPIPNLLLTREKLDQADVFCSLVNCVSSGRCTSNEVPASVLQPRLLFTKL